MRDDCAAKKNSITKVGNKESVLRKKGGSESKKKKKHPGDRIVPWLHRFLLDAEPPDGDGRGEYEKNACDGDGGGSDIGDVGTFSFPGTLALASDPGAARYAGV